MSDQTKKVPVPWRGLFLYLLATILIIFGVIGLQSNFAPAAAFVGLGLGLAYCAGVESGLEYERARLAKQEDCPDGH